MMKTMRAGLMIVVQLGLLILPLAILPAAVSAHGGEEHDESAPVASKGQMNTKLAKTDAHEILLKYPTPKPSEETALRVFITDIKTNAPVGEIKIAMVVSYDVQTANAETIKATATPTDTPGMYESHVAFPQTGQYNIALQLTGAGASEEVTVKGISVPEATASSEKRASPFPTFLTVMVVVLVGIASATYFFWVRPLNSVQEEALTVSQYPGAGA